MKIISGQFGGRFIKAPSGHRTHPMSEKMRGAIFNILGDINGLTFLDAYAGSGAIAIEAMSRGAKTINAIEKDKTAYDTITQNLLSLNISSGIKVSLANVSSWIDNNSNVFFDIVVCDPPYSAVNPDVINKISKQVTAGGILVLSLPPQQQIKLHKIFSLVSKKNYGDSTLEFYKKLV